MLSAAARGIGLRGLQVVVPKHYVPLAELETHDGISAGKYTKGLGQTNMAYVDEHEDINSLCLTAVHGLLEAYDVDPKAVARVEVGTETIVDKSKSVKTHLVDLFGHGALEGIDTTNACYGGTSALFNALQYMESSYYEEGTYSVVVAGDIAVYEKGPARPTGGAGCVAMLIGPDAPLLFEPGVRGTYMEHAWDFYKPFAGSEYPAVDGHLSNDCYIRALDQCFAAYRASAVRVTGREPSLGDFQHFLFHCPYSKMVQKSYARLMYNDMLAQPGVYEGTPLYEHRDSTPGETYNDRDLMKAAVTASAEAYASAVEPSLRLSKEMGNIYCGSLYLGIASLVASGRLAQNDFVGLFSYGSGLAASMFGLHARGDVSEMARRMDVDTLLAQRVAASPQEFEDALSRREQTHHLVPFTPPGPADVLPGTYYLESVDDVGRRTYKRA
mmetsp:Transcript_30667/g.85908  ORF Transcript_30667/g.85908 Transcript_30667/m.85908 type:complete len:442 (+) Transcript_30667:76-1401(+)